MAKFGKYDSAILGVALGTIVAYPNIASNIKNFFVDIIPSTWTWFGSITVNIIIIAVFALIGYIFDRT